jgi:outer membrane protein
MPGGAGRAKEGEAAEVPPGPEEGASQSAIRNPQSAIRNPQSAILSVDEAVRIALEQNPTLQAARHERNAALVTAERNRPAFRPEVNATASQILRTPRVDLPGRRDDDDVVLPNSISRLELAVRQPIYQFGAGKAPLQRANALAAAAHSGYRRAELDTIVEVQEGYLNLLRAQALAEVARRGLELAQANLRQTRLLQERGLQAEVDVLEAERAVAQAESGALQAENGVALARANLNRLLGRSVDTPFQTARAADLPPEPGPLSELVARAVAQRPEIVTLRHNIEAAEAGIRLARASRLPRVDLEASYALQTRTALVPRSGAAAGVTITAPIFDGAARRYTIREAEERVAQLRSLLQAAEQGVALDVERQRLAMQEARARIATANRAVTAAEKALEIVRLRLELGRAVQLEVQNARLALERALADRANAEHDLLLARARLDRALGEGPTEDRR